MIIFLVSSTSDTLKSSSNDHKPATILSPSNKPLTTDQKIDRMEHILKEANFLPSVSSIQKIDAFEFLKVNKDIAKEINLRTLINVTKIRTDGGSNWKDLATYMLVN